MEDFDETYSETRLGSIRKKEEEKKRDWLVRVSTAQLVLALLGAALLLTAAKTAPKSFQRMKVSFAHVMSVDLNTREVIQTLKKGVDSFQMTEPATAETNAEPTETGADSFQIIEPAATETDSLPAAEPTGTEAAQGGEDSGNACFSPIYATVRMVTPVTGRITSPFGYRVHPITKKYGIHNGVDIAAEEGTPIAAAFNGTVEEIGSNSVRGNYVVLSHGANTKTYYLHCSEVMAEEGAVIRAGEIIAKVGQTGWATGPHLHFSVAVNGVYYNPAWLMS